MSDEIHSDAYRLTRIIRRLCRVMGHNAGGHLEGLGVSAAERAVMEHLYPEAQLSVPEIARRYRVSRQHVQVTVNSLVDKGLAAGLENPGHKRSPLMALTDPGRRVFRTVLERDRTATEKLFENVPSEDRRRAREVLDKLDDYLL